MEEQEDFCKTHILRSYLHLGLQQSIHFIARGNYISLVRYV